MINNPENNTEHKRGLKKVRRNFINRQPEEENQDMQQDIAFPFTSNDTIYIINPCLGLVELNRKICMGTQFLNPYFRVTSLTIDDRFSSKAVTLNLMANQKNYLVSWEHTASRLESYGDSELAAWAHRIRNYYSNYPNVMEKYFDLLTSENPKVSGSIRKSKLRAVLASKEIESKCSYRKLLTYSNRNSTEILSSTYSEGLLKEMGFTIESFLPWAKDNGLPTLFEKECPAHLDIAKNFLECMTLKAGPIQEGPEYITYLYDKDGYKKEVLAQYVTIVEPTPEGFFGSGYFILKKVLGERIPGQDLRSLDCYQNLGSDAYEDIGEPDSDGEQAERKEEGLEKMEVEEV